MNDQNPLEIERQRLQARYDEQPDSRVFAPLADCLRKLGRLQEALGVCHTGLSKHPRYSSAFVILGKIHLERGDDAAAREAFERVLEFDPQNLLALRQLAELDEARDDWPAAVDRWEQVTALEIDPVKAEERLEAARARLEGGAAPESPEDAGSDDEEVVDEPAIVSQSEVTGEVGGVEADDVEASEDDVAAVPEDDASRETTDHTLIGETEDRSDEVREPAPESIAPEGTDEAPPFAPGPPVPDESALAPYRTTAPDVDEDPIAAELDEEIENEADDAPASETAEPAPSAAASVAADDTIPTTEIATMTLAEIYAEQGFREKALVILRQVLERNPDAEKVARRIEELEAAAPAAEPTPEPEAPVEESAAPQPPADEPTDEPTDEDVRAAIDPEPITLRAEDTRIEPEDGPEAPEPEVEPAPPLTARTSPEAEEEDERERYGHFKNWLDRIRVDD